MQDASTVWEIRTIYRYNSVNKLHQRRFFFYFYYCILIISYWDTTRRNDFSLVSKHLTFCTLFYISVFTTAPYLHVQLSCSSFILQVRSTFYFAFIPDFYRCPITFTFISFLFLFYLYYLLYFLVIIASPTFLVSSKYFWLLCFSTSFFVRIVFFPSVVLSSFLCHFFFILFHFISLSFCFVLTFLQLFSLSLSPYFLFLARSCFLSFFLFFLQLLCRFTLCSSLFSLLYASPKLHRFFPPFILFTVSSVFLRHWYIAFFFLFPRSLFVSVHCNGFKSRFDFSVRCTSTINKEQLIIEAERGYQRAKITWSSFSDSRERFEQSICVEPNYWNT